MPASPLAPTFATTSIIYAPLQSRYVDYTQKMHPLSAARVLQRRLRRDCCRAMQTSKTAPLARLQSVDCGDRSSDVSSAL